VTHLCEAGQVWLPDPRIAPWVDAFLHELVTFPNAATTTTSTRSRSCCSGSIARSPGRWTRKPPKGEKSEAAQIAGMRF
jgi:hypothetical protein